MAGTMTDREPCRPAPNWSALLTAMLIAAPFLRALWHVLSALDSTGPGLSADGWLAVNADLLLSGAIIAGLFVADSLRAETPSRGFLLALGVGCAVFTLGIQLDAGLSHRLAILTFAGPVLAAASGCGAHFCLQRAFGANARP